MLHNMSIAGACGAGVQGFGQADSNACLYVGSDGERGVLAQKPILKGEIIVQVGPILLHVTFRQPQVYSTDAMQSMGS
jgi:hypothetical protein